MRRYTYAQLAEWAGVTRCRGINPRTGARCYNEDHEAGSWADEMVHWGERDRVTKAGIRRFLLLCAMANPVVANSTPGWQQIYMANQWVKAAADSLVIRLPSQLSSLDRARVRAAIGSLPTNTELRAEALEWSRP